MTLTRPGCLPPRLCAAVAATFAAAACAATPPATPPVGDTRFEREAVAAPTPATRGPAVVIGPDGLVLQTKPADPIQTEDLPPPPG